MDLPISLLADDRDLFVEAIRRGDAAAASDFYSADARLMPPSSVAVVGRDQIRAFWQAGLSSGMADIDYQPSDVRGDAAIACEVGRYALRFASVDGATLVERGNYIHVHERQHDGRWLCTVDAFTPGGDE
jgi:ketosteroid isomerase-like protein